MLRAAYREFPVDPVRLALQRRYANRPLNQIAPALTRSGLQLPHFRDTHPLA
jgi:hypothetical protein